MAALGFLNEIENKDTNTQTMVATDFYLPDECWEYIFKFLSDGDHNRHRYLEPLSVVSKQLLSITNRLRFSLTVWYPSCSFNPCLLQRFTNITSLNFTRYSACELNVLLYKISLFPLKLTSLNISDQHTVPVIGLRAFSENITTLTSLTCSKIFSLHTSDLILIADCFPLLEELDLSNPLMFEEDLSEFFHIVETFPLTLFKLRKVNFSLHHYINDELLLHLFKNLNYLEEAIVLNCHLITQAGIAFALDERPTLSSLSYTSHRVWELVSSQFVDSLVKLKCLSCFHLTCPNITDELLYSIGREGLPLKRLVLEDRTSFSYKGIYYLLSKCSTIQHLGLQYADFLNDQHVAELSVFLGNLVSINLSECKMLAEIALFALVRNCPLISEIKMKCTRIGNERVENSNSFTDFVVSPRLKLLDFSFCYNISEESNLVKLLGVNFEVPMLETLNLSYTKVNDEALYLISKRCSGLLQLLLVDCNYVTMKGVNHVVENCTQLREINLDGCYYVHIDYASMIFSRPSLRKIKAPSCFHFGNIMSKCFFYHGCYVC